MFYFFERTIAVQKNALLKRLSAKIVYPALGLKTPGTVWQHIPKLVKKRMPFSAHFQHPNRFCTPCTYQLDEELSLLNGIVFYSIFSTSTTFAQLVLVSQMKNCLVSMEQYSIQLTSLRLIEYYYEIIKYTRYNCNIISP